MILDEVIRRAQMYRFLAEAFLYPTENWLEDLPVLAPILEEVGLSNLRPSSFAIQLSDLQAEHLRTFGLTGSLCYETEIGMPNEYRQSQEMADIAGFYRAFGFQVGGRLRERPDHLATELEFLYVLSLKEAYAVEKGIREHAEVCAQARHSFLRDHLGRWIGLFAEGLVRVSARDSGEDGTDNPYLWLACLAAAFVQADAQSLGLTLDTRPLVEMQPTPLGPDLSCETCPANDQPVE